MDLHHFRIFTVQWQRKLLYNLEIFLFNHIVIQAVAATERLCVSFSKMLAILKASSAKGMFGSEFFSRHNESLCSFVSLESDWRYGYGSFFVRRPGVTDRGL